MTMQTTADPRLDFDKADRMRRALRVSGISVQQMADNLEVSRNTVTNWINGHANPRNRDLAAFATSTGFPREWLINGDTPKTQPLDYTATVTHIIRRRPPTRTDATGPRNRRRAS